MDETGKRRSGAHIYAIFGAVLALGVFHVGMSLLRESRPLLPEIPFFVPMSHGFWVLGAVCVAFMAFGRHRVMREPIYYWTGVAFALLAIHETVYILIWPGLRADGQAIVGRVALSSSAWLFLITSVLFAAFLTVASLAKWPTERALIGRRWAWSIVGWTAAAIATSAVPAAFDGHWPETVYETGAFSALSLELTLVLIFAYAAGGVLSTLRHWRSRESLPAYVALLQICGAFLYLGALLGQKRYSAPWYAGRIFFTAGLLTVMFGLLWEYVRFYRREREKSLALEAAIAAREQVEAALRASEAELKASEEKYRNLARQAPAFFYEIDFRGPKYTFVNDMTCAHSGYTREEMLAMNPLDMMTAESAQRFQERVRRFLSGENLDEQVEYTIRVKDGRLLNILLNATFTADEDGKPIGATVIAHDVTERKRAEEEIRELSQRLSYHMTHSPLAVIEWGPDMRLTRWEGAAERIFGWAAAEVLGKRMEDFRWIYDEDVTHVEEVSGDLTTGSNPRRFSANRNYRKDGAVVDCEWYNSSLVDENGKLRSILSLVLDVTDRNRAAKALRESEGQLRLFVEHAPVAIAMFDREMRYLAVSQRWREDNGLGEAPILGRVHYEVFPETTARWREIHRRGLAGETWREAEDLFERTDGRAQWLRWEVHPWRAAGGAVGGIVIFTEDITELKIRERRIARLSGLYAMLSRVNETIVRTSDELALYREVCEIIVADGRFPLAWIGCVKGTWIEPVAAAGPEREYVNEIRIEVDGVLGSGPSGTAVRENRAVVANDMTVDSITSPWRDSAVRHGFRGSASLPLRRGGEAVGALGIYSREPGIFDPEQMQLLESLSADISYALDALDKEKWRATYEGALAESEARFRSAFDDSAVAMALTAPDLRLLKVNEAYCRLFGFTAAEMTGKSIADLTHADDWPANLAGMDAVTSGAQSTFRMEKRSRRKDGRFIWVEVGTAPVRGANGRVLYYVTHIQDIGAARQTREELEARVRERTRELTAATQAAKDERQRFYDVLETLPALICLLTPDYYVVFANKSFRDKFGEANGRHCYEYCFGKSAPCEFCQSFKPFQTGQPHHWEAAGPDGSVIAAHAFPFADADGSPLVLEMDIDITEHRRAETALRERTDELRRASLYTRSLIEASLDALATIGPDGTITDVNKATENLIGVPRAQLIGSDFFGYFTEPEKATAGYRQAFSNGLVRDYPLTIRHVSGATTDVHYNAIVYRDERGDVQGVFAAARDLTERNKAEKELRALNEELAQRAEQLRALAAELNLAEDRERRRLAQVLHDHLQQLLAAAKLGIATAMNKTPGPQAREAMTQVMDLLVQSIEMSRSLTAELAPPILYDGGLVESLRWLARWIREKHGLTVELRLDETIDAVSDVRVLYFQATRELLFNVAKHAGVSRAKIYLDEWGPDRLKITVVDNGAGFDAGRLTNPDQTSAGGFGLFNIRERLQWNGGRLEIVSKPGRGTRATIFGPRKRTEAARQAAAAAPPAVVAEPASSAGGAIRVLIADDHRIVREGLVRLLREAADIAVVAEAENGQQAIELARATAPDVAIMDINMPILNGVEATRAITAERPQCRVIALSMHRQSDMETAMREAGAVAYLPKDGPVETLIDAVRGAGKSR